MTTFTAKVGNATYAPATRPLRRALKVAGGVLRALMVRWNDLVESGQLGPVNETVTSRRTGGRI